jgi:hypothetical protein
MRHTCDPIQLAMEKVSIQRDLFGANTMAFGGHAIK